ncbi:methyltransferase domain-containing protein [Actinomadura craniellae]|uniref:methyltransferase domain-containing protein n=1 Tax=Actinomadura craniellae TaxID=2231787 RepID=UPI001F382EC7|nr:methyltransferase domain-containing protein [Actinomadura craniellae]
MKEIGERIDELADLLTASGHLTDPRWREALHAVPRHLFAPPVAWVGSADGPDRRVDRADDEVAWLDAVYSDTPIVTQLDDGNTPLEKGGDNYTSSLSAPGIVIVFLELLQVWRYHRVLEIGTGTGWTAALLSARVGAENVTTIEVDEQVSAQAAGNLRKSGYRPALICADGARGRPEAAPYDRVHVTCGVREVPYQWVEQTRPGGRVVFPWMPGFAFGHQACLTVTGSGEAVGRFPGNAGYMMLRSQRFDRYAPPAEGGEKESTTRLDPRTVAWDSYGCDVAIAGMLPGVTSVEEETGDGSFRLHLRDPGGSWAVVHHERDRDEYPVRQAGERGLWDETEAAYLRWVSWGRPDRDRFGLTVTSEGQRVWLDSPSNVL